MNVAVIKNELVINAAVFDEIETAYDFLAKGALEDADTVAELPEGFGIGDSYDGTDWIKAAPPEPRDPEDPPEPPEPPGISESQLKKLTQELLYNCVVQFDATVQPAPPALPRTHGWHIDFLGVMQASYQYDRWFYSTAQDAQSDQPGAPLIDLAVARWRIDGRQVYFEYYDGGVLTDTVYLTDVAGEVLIDQYRPIEDFGAIWYFGSNQGADSFPDNDNIRSIIDINVPALNTIIGNSFNLATDSKTIVGAINEVVSTFKEGIHVHIAESEEPDPDIGNPLDVAITPNAIYARKINVIEVGFAAVCNQARFSGIWADMGVGQGTNGGQALGTHWYLHESGLYSLSWSNYNANQNVPRAGYWVINNSSTSRNDVPNALASHMTAFVPAATELPPANSWTGLPSISFTWSNYVGTEPSKLGWERLFDVHTDTEGNAYAKDKRLATVYHKTEDYITTVSMTAAGTGYSIDDYLTLVCDGFTLHVTVDVVGAGGAIVEFDSEATTHKLNVNGAATVTGGTGTGAGFSFSSSLVSPAAVIDVEQVYYASQGIAGADGIWLPNVDTAGNLQWELSHKVTPPLVQNIKGEKGNKGDPGIQGVQGESGASGINFRGSWYSLDLVNEPIKERDCVQVSSGDNYYATQDDLVNEPPGAGWLLFVMAGAPGPQGNTGGQGIKGAPEHVVSSVSVFATTATYPVGAYALYLGATTVYSSATYNNGDVIHKTADNVVVYAGNIIGPQGQVGPQGFSVGSFPSTAGTVETYQPVFTVNAAWENAGSSPCRRIGALQHMRLYVRAASAVALPARGSGAAVRPVIATYPPQFQPPANDQVGTTHTYSVPAGATNDFLDGTPFIRFLALSGGIAVYSERRTALTIPAGTTFEVSFTWIM